MRSRKLVGSAIVIALAVLALAPVGARATDGTIDIRAHFDGNGGVVLPQNCSVGQEGFCTITIDGQATWTGSFMGVSNYRGYAHFDPTSNTVQGEIWEFFRTVSVEGCGRGSMLWHGNLVIDQASQRPTTGQIRGHGTWIYEQGTGTGDLARLSSGTFEMKDVGFTMPFVESNGDITGTIRCATA